MSFAFRLYSGTMLSEMTHREDPWLKARERAGAVDGEACKEPILMEDIEAYFSGVVEKLDIRIPADKEISVHGNEEVGVDFLKFSEPHFLGARNLLESASVLAK